MHYFTKVNKFIHIVLTRNNFLFLLTDLRDKTVQAIKKVRLFFGINLHALCIQEFNQGNIIPTLWLVQFPPVPVGAHKTARLFSTVVNLERFLDAANRWGCLSIVTDATIINLITMSVQGLDEDHLVITVVTHIVVIMIRNTL